MPYDVMHIPGLGFDGLIGYSPIAIAKNALGTSMATDEYASKFFENGASPSGVLEYPGVVKDPEKLRESCCLFLSGRQIYYPEVAVFLPCILESRRPPKPEPMIEGYTGFLYYDKNGKPLVALHWEHYFRNAVNRYNEIYRVQMPAITPHVCRHTYCSNMARAGMNPKTLQYLMGLLSSPVSW